MTRQNCKRHLRVSLLLTLFIVGLALPCWAEGVKEPTYPPYCWVQPPGTDLWYPCDSGDAKLADCVHLMELAMKALDGSALGPSLQEDKVFKLWERAKNSCWSDLKDLQPQHYH